MLSLELFTFYHWAKTLLCIKPKSCKSWAFLLWLLGGSSILSPVWVVGTATSNTFRYFFSQLQAVFSKTGANHYSATHSRGTLCCSLTSSLSVRLSPFQYSVLWMIAILVSWTLNFTSSPHKVHYSLWVPPLLALWPGTLQDGKQSNHRAHLAYFLSLRDHYPLLPDVQCPENHCFQYFVHLLDCYW